MQTNYQEVFQYIQMGQNKKPLIETVKHVKVGTLGEGADPIPNLQNDHWPNPLIGGKSRNWKHSDLLNWYCKIGILDTGAGAGLRVWCYSWIGGRQCYLLVNLKRGKADKRDKSWKMLTKVDSHKCHKRHLSQRAIFIMCKRTQLFWWGRSSLKY